MKIDKIRTIFFFVGLLSGAMASYFKAALSLDTSQLTSVLVTLFSVMAGFLIATITFIIDEGHPEFHSRMSYKKYQKLFDRRLRRNTWMFYCYLCVLLAILLASLLRNVFPVITDGLERLYVGLGLAAMIWSFTLPSVLAQLQKDKARIWKTLKK